MKYKCPCCGYYTLEEPPGNYEICPVCFWEDDPKASSAPNIAFGANHISLKVARMNFRQGSGILYIDSTSYMKFLMHNEERKKL